MKIKKFLFIIIGCLLYGIGVGIFLDPANIISGGVTGISMILSRIFPVNTGFFVLAINIPILIIGKIVFGGKFFFLTLLGTTLSALSLSATEMIFLPFLPLTQDKFVSAVAGQSIVSLGLALVFFAGATTGGTDVIVKLIYKKFPYITMGKIIFIVDFIVILSSVLVFGNIENGIYSFVAITAGNIVFDKILCGFDSAGIVIIISEKSSEIAESLLKNVDVGVTFFNGCGGYTNERRTVLFVTAKKRSLPKIKDTVRKTDKNSFLILTSANEVLGNGFKM